MGARAWLTWSLDRIDQPALPLSRTYSYTRNGSGVTAYILDTGIVPSHADFGGRAAVAYDALGGNGIDCHGHGTHVAGTIGGTTYGVAKGVQLRGVRVLGCTGSGSTSGIINALNWLRTNAVRPAVANMSLGGGRSSNESQNACNVSPASAASAFKAAGSGAGAGHRARPAPSPRRG